MFLKMEIQLIFKEAFDFILNNNMNKNQQTVTDFTNKSPNSTINTSTFVKSNFSMTDANVTYPRRNSVMEILS